VRYLRPLPEDYGNAGELRETAALVQSRDPLAPRLSSAERRRRLELNLAVVRARLGNCPTDLSRAAGWAELATDVDRLTAAVRRRAPLLDAIEEAVDLMLRAERETAGVCGPQGPADRAVVLIGERHQAEPQ
jgi:hypothetical protein